MEEPEASRFDVLLVEDNPGDVRLVQEALPKPDETRQSFDLTQVNALEEAMASVGERSYDVILLDLTLPDSSGFDTIIRMHEAAPRTPIIVLTGVNDNSIKLRAVNRGVQDYLEKNRLDSSELLRSIVYSIERKRVTEALFFEKERMRITLDAIGDGVITTDVGRRVRYMNPVAETLTGWKVGEAYDQYVNVVFPIQDQKTGKPLSELVENCLTKGEVVYLRDGYSMRSRDGQVRAIQDSCAPIRDDSGDTVGSVIVFHDVTEQRRLTQQVQHQATHDALTDLINRPEFAKRLRRAIESARDRNVTSCMCYLDFDRFKLVNDAAGHDAGDEFLRQITQLISDRLRARDNFARLGGDEFGLLLEGCELGKAVEIAESLIQLVREFQFEWDDRVFEVGLSIGIMPILPDAISAAEVIRLADVACYAAKDFGRNCVYIHGEADSAVGRRHRDIRIAGDLRKALRENRFELVLQPIVSLLDDDPPCSQFEALLRMRTDDCDSMSPGLFVPVAERYGFMPEIDRWVIAEAMRTLGRLATGAPECGISINLSGQSLNDGSLVEYVLACAREAKVPHSHVCFEITESAAARDIEEAALLLARLREHGFRVALDDFGRGFSSFAALSRLPVDLLKLDGSLIKEIVSDNTRQAMVSAILNVGRTMNLQTIAEWVESEEAAAALRELGVDYGQGFLFGPPLCVEDALQSMEARRSR